MSIWLACMYMILQTAPHRGEAKLDLSRVPEAYKGGVEESWRLAGRQRGELEEFLAGVADSLFDEACFLVANVPYRDLGVIDAATLRENLHWAAWAREQVPWARDLPEELFRHYVLPYRASQERIQSWRPFFFSNLFDMVKDCTTMTEAALTVNRWLDEKISFEPTAARDQGPVTTVRRGVGRCEEMTIAFIAAARSVCLPARQCWTPWWSMADNNHAWAEVWADGAWHYLGAGEYSDELDTAWFTTPARSAAVVYSLCFGRFAGDDVYKAGDRYAIINSTSVYALPCTLEVCPVMSDSDPLTVAVSVFNWGAFRPVAELEAHGDQSVRFVVGPGSYLVTSGNDSLGSWRIAEAFPYSLRRIAGEVADPMPPEGFLWLRGGP